MQLSLLLTALLTSLCGRPASALSPALHQAVVVLPTESRCEACINLIAILKAYVSNPTTQQRVMNLVLEDVCPKLPPDARQYCAIYTPIGVAALTGWIESTQASELCEQAELCPERVSWLAGWREGALAACSNAAQRLSVDLH